MPWEWKDSADKAKKSGRGEKRDKRAKYTELDMYPWVCTAPGCKQAKNWNIYTKCKDCGAVRLTPPLTKLPGTHESMDWEAKYKALEAQTKKDKTSDQKEPTIVVDAPQEIDSDTDTDSEDEIGLKLAKELEGVIAQFAKLGQTSPQLEVVKQLVTVTKRSDNPILTDAQVEVEITKAQKTLDDLSDSIESLKEMVRLQQESIHAMQEKIKETEKEYASVLTSKERWLAERLQRFAETRKNEPPEEAPWEKQAAQRKKERREAHKRSALEKKNTKARMEEVLKALSALSKTADPADLPKNETPADPAKAPMEGVEAGSQAKQKNEAADPGGKLKKGAAASSGGA